MFRHIFGDQHQKKAFEICDSGTERLRNGPMSDSSFYNEVKSGEDYAWMGYKYTDRTMFGLIGNE